jgi:parvulin-like peptidyl-prolyl isomerase
MQRDYLANVLLERVLSEDSLTVTDEEITRYYEDNQKEFILQEPEYRLSVIVLKNEGIAREVWRNLVRGRADFGEMARAHSVDIVSAQRDGDIGFLKRDDISDAAFRSLVFSMQVGELSNPVLTESGYCICMKRVRSETSTMYEAKS